MVERLWVKAVRDNLAVYSLPSLEVSSQTYVFAQIGDAAEGTYMKPVEEKHNSPHSRLTVSRLTKREKGVACLRDQDMCVPT